MHINLCHDLLRMIQCNLNESYINTIDLYNTLLFNPLLIPSNYKPHYITKKRQRPNNYQWLKSIHPIKPYGKIMQGVM